jgi:hypothetical protein
MQNEEKGFKHFLKDLFQFIFHVIGQTMQQILNVTDYIPLCSKLSVYLYNLSNTSKDNIFYLVVSDGLYKNTDKY